MGYPGCPGGRRDRGVRRQHVAPQRPGQLQKSGLESFRAIPAVGSGQYRRPPGTPSQTFTRGDDDRPGTAPPEATNPTMFSRPDNPPRKTWKRLGWDGERRWIFLKKIRPLDRHLPERAGVPAAPRHLQRYATTLRARGKLSGSGAASGRRGSPVSVRFGHHPSTRHRRPNTHPLDLGPSRGCSPHATATCRPKISRSMSAIPLRPVSGCTGVGGSFADRHTKPFF